MLQEKERIAEKQEGVAQCPHGQGLPVKQGAKQSTGYRHGGDAFSGRKMRQVFFLLGLEIYKDPMRNSPLREKGSNEENLMSGKAILCSSKRFVVTDYANLVRPFNHKRPLSGWTSLKY